MEIERSYDGFSKEEIKINQLKIKIMTLEQQIDRKEMIINSLSKSDNGTTKNGNRLIPVTILSGFLGSGKTTLLKHILTSSKEQLQGKRIAIIENEFGDEIGIEKLIVKNNNGSGANENAAIDDLFVELSNGCLCCSVRDDLVVTLERMLKYKSKFDYIIIECSGLALPGSLASIFWLDEALESQLKLDAIITVVDAFNIYRQLESKGTTNKHIAEDMDKVEDNISEAYLQIAHADIILLNKLDLIDSSESSSQILERIRKVNPLAPCHGTIRCNIELNKILDVGAFDRDKKVINVIKDTNDDTCSCCSDENHHNDHSHTHEQMEISLNTHIHEKGVSSKIVRLDSSFLINPSKLTKWIGTLLWEEKKDEIFRIKGMINAANCDNVYLIQAVHETFEIEETTIAWGNEKRVTKIVFIGKDLNELMLTEGMKRCCGEEDEE